ncbi:hypothetical protein ACFV47_06200 [Streptomyces solisilvae]
MCEQRRSTFVVGVTAEGAEGHRPLAEEPADVADRADPRRQPKPLEQ